MEIHEAAITSASFLAKLRDQLRDLDIGLAYDDFGAGQARLLEMADAPPDVIKFDIHMIRGLCEAESVTTFVETVLDRFQRPDVTVVNAIRTFARMMETDPPTGSKISEVA